MAYSCSDAVTDLVEFCANKGLLAQDDIETDDLEHQIGVILQKLQTIVPVPETATAGGNIFRYLDLSTSHVSEETMHGLDNGSVSGITIANYEYGVFVSVPGEVSDIDNELDCPEDLKVVLRYARGIGCDVLRFDSDGMAIIHLPHFDW